MRFQLVDRSGSLRRAADAPQRLLGNSLEGVRVAVFMGFHDGRATAGMAVDHGVTDAALDR